MPGGGSTALANNMRTTCLINCFNYRDFVGEAVRSALRQTQPFTQVIIVDDGSTDGSGSYLEREFGCEPTVTVFRKNNGGQLSAFHAGTALAVGDIVFFLDADDRYPVTYVEAASTVYQEQPEIDCVIAARTFFGHPGKTRIHHRGPSRELGFSVAATLLDQQWIGGSTSCLSFRRELLHQVLPYPKEQDWRTRADDVLVYGSSILGSRKYFLAAPAIEYRLHDENQFAQRKITPAQKLLHGLAVHELLAWYGEQASRDVRRLPALLHHEFRTKQRPTWHDYRRYMRMVARGGAPWELRCRQWLRITGHMISERRRWSARIPAASRTEPRRIPSPPRCRAA